MTKYKVLGRAGTGERFKRLTKTLSKRPGVTNPAALAASIGRKKFGKKKFQNMAKRGKGKG